MICLLRTVTYVTNFHLSVFVQKIVKTQILVKKYSKSAYLRNLKSCKKVDFLFFLKILSKYPCIRVSQIFVFWIFVEKVTFKIPIGTILNFFCKKSRFLHTLEIFDFSWDNHVIYRKKFTFFFVFQLIFPIVDKSKFHFFQSFLP